MTSQEATSSTQEQLSRTARSPRRTPTGTRESIHRFCFLCLPQLCPGTKPHKTLVSHPISLRHRELRAFLHLPKPDNRTPLSACLLGYSALLSINVTSTTLVHAAFVLAHLGALESFTLDIKDKICVLRKVTAFATCILTKKGTFFSL